MKHNINFVLICLPFLSLVSGCKAQSTFGAHYLSLIKSIPLPNVKGRIDHLSVDPKNRTIYIAALGNHSVEVVSFDEGKDVHSIKGIDEPQGVLYVPVTNELFIADGGTGSCYFYNASSYIKTATIQLDSDADNVRYDSTRNLIYVGFGNGGIAIINAISHSLQKVILLPAHPEGFQIDETSKQLFVNLPQIHSIGVVNLTNNTFEKKWTRATPSSNFPMALSNSRDFLFVGYRHPSRLAAVNRRSGQQEFIVAMADDADDLFYDESRQRIYASCGGGYSSEGFINIFQVAPNTSLLKIASIPTRSGARTSLYSSQLNLLIVSEPSGLLHEARLAVYKIL